MSSPSPHRLGERTAPEALAAQRAGALLVLPVGATEQHGPGLPLATDAIRAEAVADRVAAALAPRALVLPALPYGVSPHHARVVGTVTLTPVRFVEFVADLATSVADSGWTRLLVVNGHGGNAPALGVVQQTLLASRPELRFAWTNVSGLAPTATAAMPRTEVTGHAGESETAQMLAIAEHLVRVDALEPGATTLDALAPLPRLSRVGQPSLAVHFDDYADPAILGDPRTATRAHGEAILDEAHDAIVAFATALLES